MSTRAWKALAASLSLLGCARERPAAEPCSTTVNHVTTYGDARTTQPGFAAGGAAQTPLAGGFLYVQTPSLTDLVTPLFVATSCFPGLCSGPRSDAPTPVAQQSEACRDQVLVRMSNPRILSRGAVWRAGEEAQLVVALTSPRTNGHYTGFRATATPGVTPAVSQVHPSQGLMPGRATPIGDLVRADSCVAPGTKVTFHIVVSPGEECPGIHALDFETVVW